MMTTINPNKIINMPDKFHFDKEHGIFYENTPFGIKNVNHSSLINFYNKLKEIYGNNKNFNEMINDLTEYRLIEPSFFVTMYEQKNAFDHIADIMNKYKERVETIYNLAQNITKSRVVIPTLEIPLTQSMAALSPLQKSIKLTA